MKIIIDGCDLTGKTTLIKKLLKHYKKLSYLHFSYNDRTDYEFYDMMLEKENFIADRHFIDEIIYPKIFNRKRNLSINNFNKLVQKCKKNDIKIIILTTSEKNLNKRLKKRKNEEKEIQNKLYEINNMFISLANKNNFKIFDTSINNFKEIINYIEGDKNE